MLPGLTRTVAAGQSGDTWSPSRSDGPLNLKAVSEMAPLRGRDSSPDQQLVPAHLIAFQPYQPTRRHDQQRHKRAHDGRLRHYLGNGGEVRKQKRRKSLRSKELGWLGGRDSNSEPSVFTSD